VELIGNPHSETPDWPVPPGQTFCGRRFSSWGWHWPINLQESALLMFWSIRIIIWSWQAPSCSLEATAPKVIVNKRLRRFAQFFYHLSTCKVVEN